MMNKKYKKIITRSENMIKLIKFIISIKYLLKKIKYILNNFIKTRYILKILSNIKINNKKFLFFYSYNFFNQ